MITATKVYKSLKEAISGFVGQLFSITTSEELDAHIGNEEIITLLREFQLLFEEQKQLPSVRNLDHQIPLIPWAKPVNIRLCKSSFIHKKEMERLVREMLSNGILQHSSNSFSPPVLLVKK
jgi:hypothetical protein